MADLLFDLQGPPAAPSAASLGLFPHSSSKRWASKDDTGKVLTLPGLTNGNTADVVANAADTYLTGSSIAVPSHLLQALTIFKWKLVLTKSAAGIVAPTWNVRVGTLGTVADASRLLFTSPSAQTAVADTGFVDIIAIVRNAGAAAVMAGGLTLQHALAATGLASVAVIALQVTSAAFDATVAGLIVGLSTNPGAAGVWTHQVVEAEALGM